ncbi:adhesion G protein-coupled receptor L4-like [Orbicella faveolata]|uniref:adhesion G protein-coupled receptor L4-like n=1 Tax=Orbicella faveolata TaxID=48498 RepID=UPI0009E5EA22|nr:adhesion G protein-coupled receptor L4-like [Orbicella faveolata]
MADNVDPAFSKVYDVCGFKSLNEYQKNALKYVIEKKKEFLDEFNGKSFFLDDTWETSHTLELYTDAAGSVGFGAVFVISPDIDDGFEEEDDLLEEVAVKLFDAWINQNSNESSRSGTNTTQQEKMKEVFLASTALEQFMLKFAQYHLNPTTPQIQFNTTHADLQLRKIFYQNESEFLLQETKGQNFVQIPAENFLNGSVVVGVMYKDLHQIFLTNHSDTQNKNKTRHLNTIIMSARITPPPVTLKENITLTFRNLEVKAATLKRDCVSLIMSENNPLGWSEEGCRVKSMDNSQTECSCSHLTHFAVLMQFDADCEDHTISQTDHKALEILAYLGLALSLIGIGLTILGYVFLTDMEGPLSQIRVSLVASLGAGQIVFLAGIGATENKVKRVKGACITVAALVQYFLMAAFCWMLVEGIYLYLFIVQVYNVSNKLKICHAVSWGFPALVVALSLSIAAGKDGVETFVSEEYCWMSSANNLIWIFIVFVVLIELSNVLILARVVKEMTSMQQAKDSKTEQIRLGIKACVLLVPLLGFTWLFGLLSPLHKAFAYIFTIFNTTQGFFIFLLHCVRNTEIRDRFKRKIHGIFPVIDDRASSKRSSGIKYSAIGNASLKKIEVKSSNKNSKLDDSTSGNASLKKIEVKPFNRNSKLDDCTGSNASLKKIEVNPSNRNSKLDDSTDGNAWLKNIEVNPSNRNTKLDDSTGVKPFNRKSKLHDSTSGNASLKKVEVNPSIRNSKLDDREGVMLR